MEVISGKKAIKGFIKAVITSTALTMDYSLIADEISTFGYANPEMSFVNLSKLLYAIEIPTISSILLIGFLTFFYVHVNNIQTLSKHTVVGIRVLAFFASASVMVGKLFYSYHDIGLLNRGALQLVKGMFVFCGLFMLFSAVIDFAVSGYIEYCKKNKDMRCGRVFDQKWIGIGIAAVIFAVWLPTIMAYYPAVFMGDSEDIIYMAYNYPTGLVNIVLPIKEGIYVTNHHPVVYTLYISVILHAVSAFGGSNNFGIFLCAIIQCLITVCILTYSCMYCAKYLKNEKLALVAVVFYALCPWMPKYAVMISKDTFFADLLLLLAILIHKSIHTRDLKKDMTALIAVSVGVALIRKNGFYILILTFVLAILLYKNLWKRWLLALACIFAVYILYSNVALPAAGIPEGSIAEMLSIPFQQTARYVKYHGEEVTDEEKHAISGVLDYDTLAKNYSGSLSDPVKRTYNKNATRVELADYFIVWFQMFWRHPGEYVTAFFNNYYGYFYPVVNDAMKLARTSVGSMANTNRDGYFDFSHCYDSFHTRLRDSLTFYDLIWMHLPVLNLFMTSALYVWVVLAALLLSCVRRDRAAVLVTIMYLFLIFTVIVGPSNAINYERYVFPCILGMPFLVCICFACDSQTGSFADGKE
ncbi:MAG: hypothetical protein HDR19_03400 [Lachnospiraceae bacterium]|nr:hypothetical protein [Lachnospiraceae bacterium]